MICELCEKEVETLFKTLYNNEDYKMLCPKCFGYETDRGDMEYERQKEEGI